MILRTIFLLTTLIFSSHALCSTDTEQPENLFAQANTLYQNGEFKKAYEAYNALTPKTNSIHFNMGNCAFKLGKKGHALLHWRQAETNWGLWGHEELRHNIALIKTQIAGNKTSDETATLAQTLANAYQATKNICVPLVRAIPLLNLQLIVLFAWIFLFVFLRFFPRRIPKIAIILFFALFACAGATLALKYSLNYKTYGVIVTEKAQLLSGPGDNFSLLGQLPEASEVAILKQSGDFYKIRHAGRFGWINKNTVESF